MTRTLPVFLLSLFLLTGCDDPEALLALVEKPQDEKPQSVAAQPASGSVAAEPTTGMDVSDKIRVTAQSAAIGTTKTHKVKIWLANDTKRIVDVNVNLIYKYNPLGGLIGYRISETATGTVTATASKQFRLTSLEVKEVESTEPWPWKIDSKKAVVVD